MFFLLEYSIKLPVITKERKLTFPDKNDMTYSGRRKIRQDIVITEAILLAYWNKTYLWLYQDDRIWKIF